MVSKVDEINVIDKIQSNTEISVAESAIAYVNPFFIDIKGTNIVDDGAREIYKKYRHAYVLISKTDNYDKEFFESDTKIDRLEELSKNYQIVKVNIHITMNNILVQNAVMVNDKLLNKLFDANIKDGNLDEIVIPLVNYSYESSKIIIEQYMPEKTFDDINNVIETTQYISSGKFSIDYIIKTIQETSKNYWTISKCNINMNKLFMFRRLRMNNVDISKIKFSTTEDNVKLITDNKKTHGGYVEDDETKNINTKHFRTYDYFVNTEFNLDNKQEIEELISKLITYQSKYPEEYYELYRVNLLVQLLVSKDYCHYVINNKKILEQNQDVFNKYKILFNYAIGYAWKFMYIEESVIYTNASRYNRFVFDIDTAEKLPIYPFTFENIHSSPYVSSLYSKKYYSSEKNCFSIKPLVDYNKYYGICSRDEFFKRANIFATGNSTVNIFHDIGKEFSISGSIIPACMVKYNPLIDVVSSATDSYDTKYNKYFEHYYGNSDIDVMVNCDSPVKFISYSSKLINKIIENCKIERSDVKLDIDRKTGIIITPFFLTECIDDLNEVLSTKYNVSELENIFTQIENERQNGKDADFPQDIKEYFYGDYVQNKQLLNRELRQLATKYGIELDSELLYGYRKITSIDDITFRYVTYNLNEKNTIKRESQTYYFVNDFRDEKHQVDDEENYMVFKFSENIKFKMVSDKIKREIEIFAQSKDPFHTVSRFHLPCVRGYIHDNNVYILPSCITSAMTLINIDYKYFAGSRDPINILNKYRMRGYSTILNKQEMNAFYNYNTHIKSNNGQFYEKYEDIISVIGGIDITNKIFQPKVFSDNVDRSVYNVLALESIKDMNDLKTVYKNEGYKYSEDTIIVNNDGKIIPFRNWIVQRETSGN